jgi:FkbM family methyltransferase
MDRNLATTFEDFAAGATQRPADSTLDFTGAVRRHEFYIEPVGISAAIERPDFPAVNDELFEWITLCDAVRSAQCRFTFFGAGYGRWTANAVCAARNRGSVDIDAVMVEAEPQHCEWARLNMADNHIDRFELIEAAVAAQDGEALFCIRWPQGQNARDFYGQGLMPADVQTQSTAETYYGRPILVFNGSWEGIMINTRSLRSIIGDRHDIDLMDIDIQGAEGDVVTNSVGVLTERVKRLYIETHNAEVEANIRSTLAGARWDLVYDFAVGGVRPTPYGDVDFGGGGCQSWINLRL